MLTKRIIPCLDVKNGHVVKGVKFKNHEIVGDIVERARYYSEQGADELVFYDITASVEKRTIDYSWVERVAKEINIPFCVAGGLRTLDDMRRALKAGADKISINSPALENPDLINQGVHEFGSQCIVIGIDSQRKEGEDYVYMYTGDEASTTQTARKTSDWIREVIHRGAGEIVLNSMDTDGVKNGYNIELLKKIESLCSVPLIASGGAGKMEDFAEVFQKTTVDGALAASVFHKNTVSIPRLKEYLCKQEIPIRIIH